MLTYPNYNYTNHSASRQANNRRDLKPLIISIYQNTLNIMAREALEKKEDEVETGGAFFGLKTRSAEFVIMLATVAGKNAYHSRYRFQMDLNYFRQYDRHVKDYYKLDHDGDWHTHLIDLSRPSNDDIGNTHNISRKNDYDRYIQIVLTICSHGRKKYIKFNPYIYTDAKHGLPQPCLINVLPGTSPIRLALESDSNSPELTKIYTRNDNELIILPLAQKTVSSLAASQLSREEKLARRIEKQLLKLSPEVLSQVEVEINQGVTVVTVPIPSTSYCLYLAYTEESPGEIRSVYLGRDGKNNSPVEVTCKALKHGPYTHIKTIWSSFTRFVGLKHKDGNESC